MNKYITIEQAQEIAPRSDRWFKDQIKAGKIKSISEGRGSKHLIELESLMAFLKSLENNKKIIGG